MKTLKIVYPTVVLHSLEIEVSDEQAQDILEHHKDRVEFIMDAIEKIKPDDYDWIPDAHKGIDAALDAGYASIKEVNPNQPV